MSYVALYRAYRPQRFSEVAGQRHIVTTLQNAIKLNKVAHAYLFCGPRGTGKTTLAKIMAKALNCVHGPSIEPCNECDICTGITKGMISDVIEIDAASNNGVDEIRELRDGVKFSPSTCAYKVYIIDEVHMLSTGAFNALLKTLEEPPKHAIFILATTEPHKIPATILSRCQRFDFQAISSDDVFQRVKEVASLEKINVTDEALRLISDICEGGMRDALSLLDQSLSFSTDDVVCIDDVLAVSGNVSSQQTLELLESCYEKNGNATLEKLNEILSQGKEIPRVINDLIVFLRDILLYKVATLDSNKAIYSNEEFINFTKKINNNLIYSWLNNLNEIQNNIRFSNQKRAFLELGLLKMSDKELNDYVALIDRVDKLEKQLISANINRNDIQPPVTEYDYIEPSIIESKVQIEEKPIELKTDDTFVSVKMIEDVLNNGSKSKKDLVSKVFENLSQSNPNNILVQILCNGQVVASSEDCVIIALADDAYCNRLMKYDNFIKILQLINKNEEIIKDYICLPLATWSIIKADYSNKYKSGITKPTLNEIKILVKKHINTGQIEKQNDPIVDNAYDLFGKDVVKIKEEN